MTCTPDIDPFKEVQKQVAKELAGIGYRFGHAFGSMYLEELRTDPISALFPWTPPQLLWPLRLWYQYATACTALLTAPKGAVLTFNCALLQQRSCN